MDDSLKTILYVAVWIIAIPLIIYSTKLIERNRKKKIDNLKEIICPAKLIYKSTEVVGRYTATRYHITFELNDQRRKTFTVSCDTYGEILENESGLLIYKEKNDQLYFVNFQRN